MSKPPTKDPTQAELATLRREIEDLKRQLRQVPSRFPVSRPARSATAPVRVRFDWSFVDGDLSLGEILDDAGNQLNQEVVWFDGVHALASFSGYEFAGTIYWAERAGEATRAGVTRPLYRAITTFYPYPPGVSRLILEADAPWRCKVLDEFSSEVTTIIAGNPLVNRLRANLPDGGFVGYRYEWQLQRYSGATAIIDSSGHLLRGGGRGGVSAVNSGIEIEHGECFHIDLWAGSGDFSSTLVRGTNPTASAVLRNLFGAVVGYGIGAGWSFREDNNTALRDSRRASVSWTGLVASVSDYTQVTQTVTFTCYVNTWGRIYSIQAAPSGAGITPVFVVRGGRFIA